MSGCKTPTNGARWCTTGICTLSALLLAGLARTAASQTEYYNLDSNRPLRVEDAVPTERRALDAQFAPFRLETFGGGARRWRADPKLSYGLASLTEIEIRAPILLVQQPGADAPRVIGLTSIGIGGMRALNTETALFPALAVSAEVLVPAGSLAPPRTSYAVKGLLTKTASLARFSVNASYGTYSVVPPAALSPACRLLPPGAPGCNGQPSVPDVPCTRVPSVTAPALSRPVGADIIGASLSAACLTSGAPAAPASPGRSLGNRWFAGAGVDHTFALSSTLLGADVFAERLIGLSPLVDWTAEIGVRHQWSPQVVVDAGVSRHFAGSLPSTAVTIGATYAVAARRR